MRKAIAVCVASALVVMLLPVTASARVPQATGTLNGVAQNAQGQTLPQYTVRLRNTQTGQLAGSQTSNATGQFSFVGLNPSDYVVEIVNSTGNIVGTSTAVTVGAGSTVTISVSASALAAAEGAAAGAAPVATAATGALTLWAAPLVAGPIGSKGTISSAKMLMILISGLTAGPAVSL